MLAMSRELRHLRAVLDNVGAYVFTKDREGRYTYANGQVCALLGVPLAQLLGRDDGAFFDPAYSDPRHQHDRRVIEQGETLRVEEEVVLRGSAERRVYWTIKAPLRDDQGHIIGMCAIADDITERKALEKDLRRQRLLLDTVLNHVDAYVYIKSPDRRYLYVNQQTAALYGATPADVVGRRDVDLMPENAVENFGELDRKVFEQGGKQSGEESMVDLQGRVRHYWTVKVPIALPGEPQALIGFSTDITELHLLKEELKNQALTDSLTGVSNHRHFFQAAGREMTLARRHRHPLSVLLIDLDHFKQINDRYGHQAGDKVLKAVAEHFQSWMRASDVLGRIGGEEFAVLLPSTAQDAACLMAERMCRALRVLRVDAGEGDVVAPTISVGVASLADDDPSIDAVLRRADRAMYQAKADGRDCVRTA